MIGSSASEQHAYLEHAKVFRLSRPKSAELSEKEAIRGAQHGDERAFERLYELHSRRVYGLCLRMTGNQAEAEDLSQETFLTVFRKIQTFRGESAFSTWLHRIAANLVLMRLRRRPLPEVPIAGTAEGVDADGGIRRDIGTRDLTLAGSIDRVNLQRAMKRLLPKHRLVVELHDVQGYKHKEIAEILDCSIGTSKAQLHHARGRLRELLQESCHAG
jgi:RNA polymerase sigma-70 factor (ECF subfamily)